MCIKTVKLINHDCLPISMLLYIMLVYLMPLTALFNSVCLRSAYLFYFVSCPLLFLCYLHKCFLSHALSLVY